MKSPMRFEREKAFGDAINLIATGKRTHRKVDQLQLVSSNCWLPRTRTRRQ
jgi:predicted metal-dependent hydrolase